ncbi:OprD family porin [Ectopseudomonas mendocina]|uniref:OprD family porin n=1 Tax=Ectopseudomonas mendocina TaxID=300 RepID=A0ABZ2RC64_ECTME
MRIASLTARTPASLLTLGLAATASPAALADFIEDSSASLTTSNIYLNRDFRENKGQNKREEWGQGFILDIKSGYTDGTVGVGVDALGLMGIKLDSGRGTSGTDLLPTQDDGGAPDTFGHLGLTGKIKVSQTEFRYGSHILELPVAKSSQSRLLPQVFEGGLLTSKEIDGLQLLGGRLTKVVDRASTNSEKLVLNSKNKRFRSDARADHMDLIGAEYAFTDKWTGRYHAAELDDVYRQHYFGLLGSHPIGPGTLSADIRLALSKDTGAATGGKVDNRAFGAMFTYSYDAHKFGLGYQDMGGDTGFAYLDGSDPYLINFVQINDFANADERSWQARYDFDLASIGIPGLTFMTRYISGDDAQIAGSNKRGSEWERDSEIKYVVQSGPLKDVYVRLRNATFRSDFARDADENRIIVGYTLPIW